jgi:hypothetical protein
VTTDRPLITYIRVSTAQQGRSGLGIEAQRHALAHLPNATKAFAEFILGDFLISLSNKLAAMSFVGCVITVAAVSPLIEAARHLGCPTSTGTDIYNALAADRAAAR